MLTVRNDERGRRSGSCAAHRKPSRCTPSPQTPSPPGSTSDPETEGRDPPIRRDCLPSIRHHQSWCRHAAWGVGRRGTRWSGSSEADLCALSHRRIRGRRCLASFRRGRTRGQDVAFRRERCRSPSPQQTPAIIIIILIIIIIIIDWSIGD